MLDSRWSSILACPRCHRSLRDDGDCLTCQPCGERFPIVAGRPVFRDQSHDVQVINETHLSNQVPLETFDQLQAEEGWILNLGAGGTAMKVDRCIEVEYNIFRHTDVVADAHNLPFVDSAFSAVVTFNTFEHLHDPFRAAQELRRVLKPGGRLILQTAFLQPLHESPHHYYNATEFGVRNWFRDFDVQTVTASPNFNPAYTLAWLANAIRDSVGHYLGPQSAEALGRTTLDQLAEAWADPAVRNAPWWEVLQNLPSDVQKPFAAGFQLEAIRPRKAS